MDVKLTDQAEIELSIREALLSQAQFSNVEIISTIKRAVDRQVVVAKIDGTKVVVKRFIDENPAQTVSNLKAELDLMSQTMGSGSNQVNQCLHALPQAGIAVLNFAPGRTLSNVIATTNARNRLKLLKHAGEWLALYSADRRRESTFAPKYWINQLRDIAIPQKIGADDRQLLRDLIASLQLLAPKVRGCNVVHAAVHGDFVGINLHYHDSTIYGVDIQGECWHPVAKEAARFLVWQRAHSLNRITNTCHGIASSDWGAFLQSGVVSDDEIRTTLPFFIGVQIFTRFLDMQGRELVTENIR
ncbi:MAG: hypothetical protein ACTSRN_06595, partial [Alphaproteobacteria bacterium]